MLLVTSLFLFDIIYLDPIFKKSLRPKLLNNKRF